jgi:hypothetical protein
MIIKPAQDAPEIKIIAENFQEAHWLFKLLTAVKDAKDSKTNDGVKRARDILLEL